MTDVGYGSTRVAAAPRSTAIGPDRFLCMTDVGYGSMEGVQLPLPAPSTAIGPGRLLHMTNVGYGSRGAAAAPTVLQQDRVDFDV